MKQVSGQLAATLAGNDQLGASLFSLMLDVPLFLTDAGVDVSFDAGDGLGPQVYKSARTLLDTGEDVPAVRRGRSKISLNVAPDDVEITLSLGSLPGGTNIRLAAVRGAFDGKRVRVQRLFSTWFAGDTTTGPVTDVDGPCYVGDVTSAELRLVVKARTDLLSRNLPPRVIAPGCQWVLYGPGCNASLAAFSQVRTIAAGSTAASLVTTVAPTMAFGAPASLVYFTSGLNVGVQRNVKSATGTTIVPSVAFPFAQTAGETITIVRGCDRTRAMCTDVFANGLNYGGSPDVPDAVPKVVA